MRSVRIALFTAAVFLLPAAASAEPIYFTSQLQYLATPDAAGGASFGITPTTNLPSSIDPATSPTATYASLHFSPTTATGTAGATDSTGGLRMSTFWIALNMTDTASGQSGTLKLTGSAVSAVPGTIVPVVAKTTDPIGVSFDDGANFTDLKLGANTYRFQATLGDAAADGSVTGTVTLSLAPTVANTPEPGTLALAAFGLAPALGLTVRRRKA